MRRSVTDGLVDSRDHGIMYVTCAAHSRCCCLVFVKNLVMLSPFQSSVARQFVSFLSSTPTWQSVRRRWIPSAVVSMAVLVLGAVALSQRQSTYQASGKLFIQPDDSTRLNLSAPSTDALPTESPPALSPGKNSELVVERLRSPALMQQVIDWLTLADPQGQPPTPAEVAAPLSITPSTEVGVLEIAYTSSNPALSAAIVNAVMDLYLQNNLENSNQSSGVPESAVASVRIIERAEASSRVAGYLRTAALSLGVVLVSLGAFVVTAILLERSDRRVKTIAELQRLHGCAVLELFPKDPQGASLATTGIALRDAPLSLVSEIYRSLQTKIQSALKQGGVHRTPTITLVATTESTTSAAANLAMSNAETQKRTLLIDGNLYHPRQAQLWELPVPSSGLRHVLQGEKALLDALHQVHSHLWLLPSGAAGPSAERFAFSKMKQVLDTATQSFDAVIIDSPPLQMAPDALLLGQLSDGVVILSSLGTASRAQVTAARESLRNAEQNILGLIVTNASFQSLRGQSIKSSLQAHSPLYTLRHFSIPTWASQLSTFVASKLNRKATPSRSKPKSSPFFKSAPKTKEYTSADYAKEEGSRSSHVIQIEAKSNFESQEE